MIITTFVENRMMHLTLLLLIFFAFNDQQSKFITIESGDGISISAELYMAHDKSAPFIVLFHQARWSRGEYKEIAPRLNQLGYNCMAVDLRSGGEVNGVVNQTTQEAEKAMKQTRYIDSYPDIDAAVKYADEYFAEGKLIIWGSSYSSALAIRYAGDYPESVDAVLAFSPGEYFRSQGKSATYITEGAENIYVPVFITSAKGERDGWSKIYDAIPNENKQYFLPETAGNHGSRALWSKFGDSLKYWKAVETFLKTLD